MPDLCIYAMIKHAPILIQLRIREKKKLLHLDHCAKRNFEGPRMPRTAKKIDIEKMQESLGKVGVEVDDSEDVRNGI